jgi:hypothetical protein
MRPICARKPTRPPRQQSSAPCSRMMVTLSSHDGPVTDAGAAARKAGPVSSSIPLNRRSCGDKLLIEVESVASADLAATWAGEALVAKNSLTAADAKLVEDAFERRLSKLPSSEAAALSNDDPSLPRIAELQVIFTTERTDLAQAKGIDKSVLAVAAPRRYRNREHLRYVAQQACLVCGRKPSDPPSRHRSAGQTPPITPPRLA